MKFEEYINDDGVCGVKLDDSHFVGWDLEGWCDKCEEYMNLILNIPQMIEALESVSKWCCQTPGCNIDNPLCDAMIARAALVKIDRVSSNGE